MSDVHTLRKNAYAGDPRSQFQLARILLIGGGVVHAPDEALRLVKAACAQNYPQALMFHATLAALGMGRPQSFADAIRLVAQAAATGDARAQGQFATLGGTGFDIAPWFATAPVQQHFAAPRIFTVEGFLPKSACAWLIGEAQERLVAARVKDPTRGNSAIDTGRSNTGAGFSSIESDLVLQLTCLRIAAAVGVPIRQQEPTNVLCYAPGQEYSPHYDFITAEHRSAFASELERIGQRIATVLVYLNEEYEGGETQFPLLNWGFKGKTGDALIFWNISEEGQLESKSLHAGLPVSSGRKWLLSKWVREKPFPLI